MATATDRCNALQLIIIIQEEAQILETDIHVWIAAQSPVLFFCLLSSGETMLIDFILDLPNRVCHKNTGVGIRGAHLGLRTL